jgi:hypothetical protein
MPNLFRQGEHICAVYDTEAEQLAIAAEYLADGLRAGERVLQAAHRQTHLRVSKLRSAPAASTYRPKPDAGRFSRELTPSCISPKGGSTLNGCCAC